MGIHRNALAYSLTTFAASLMNTVFFFYYVKLFLDYYQLPEPWFHFSQVVYMLWNAINDPLFGYFQDNSNWSLCRSRKKAIYYGAPIWAFTFLLPWFRWGNYQDNPWLAGMHLIVTLCAYDAMLTFVLLAQCALFAEISTQREDRLRLIKYNQVASVIGSTSVFWSSIVSSNMQNFFNLKLYCIFVAVLAYFSMRYSGLNVSTKYEQKEMTATNEPLMPNSSGENLSVSGAYTITKQILSNKNFLFFVVMNFFQVFHTTFCSNFLLIFANQLIPDGVLPTVCKSVLYGASFVLPPVLILLGGNMLSKFGVYRVVMVTFIIQAIGSVLLLFAGRTAYWLLASFLIIDMTLPSLSFSLFNVLLSDIIDEDMKIHSRKLPQSSMVFGTNALITKPANSLAPMAVVAILNSYGYQYLKNLSSSDSPLNAEQALKRDELQSVMFTALCFIPLAVSLFQLLVFSFYALKNTHSVDAKYTET